MARASNCRFRNFLFLFYCDRLWTSGQGEFFFASTRLRTALYFT
jgi:hypothetical protein